MSGEQVQVGEVKAAVVVPDKLTESEHPELFALIQVSWASYFKINVAEKRLIRSSSCTWVRGDWEDECERNRTRPGSEKFSIYRYDGGLIATNERGS
jgi:hypothetical protein